MSGEDLSERRTSAPLPSLAPAVERVLPAVVYVSGVQSVPLPPDPATEQASALEQHPAIEVETTGSGVIVVPTRGIVVTNHHVVRDASELFVTLSSGLRYPAQLIAADPPSDLALLRVEAGRPLAVEGVRWGDPAELRAGDWVIAIGSPFGLEQSVSAGVVSAVGRTGLGVQGYEDFIQTDVSINPGSSGGALVNLRGEVVGINNVILSPGGGSIGIGFAIPADMVRRVATELLDHGQVRRGRVGLLVRDVGPEDAAAAANRSYGTVVAAVEPGSAAAAAGLQEGDIIIEVDGGMVRNAGGLRSMVGARQVGDEVEVTLLRDGKAESAQLRVTEETTDESAALQWPFLDT